MSADDLVFAPLAEQARLVAAREVSPVDLAAAYLARIDALDGRLRAYITVCAEEALAAARRAEAALAARAPVGPLHGVPIALKDLYATAGLRTTAGSRLRADWVPDRDATVVARLREAGAVLLGKLNMHELAYGPEGLNPHYGDPWNPWDAAVHRIAGGSSSGSAVAVAAGLCAGTLGSDTGGSIRLPCALCNLAGIKPTYGRVSRAGVLPLAWSLDNAGPMTRTVADSALLLRVIAGADERDPTASEAPVPDYVAGLTGDVRGLRLGLLRPFFLEGVEPAVRAAVERAAATLADLGAIVEEAALPGVEHAAAAFLPICWTEALAYHERDLRDRPEIFDQRTRDRLRLGAFITGVDYVNGQRGRQYLRAQTDRLLARFDALLTPTSPVVASPIGEDEVVIDGERRGRRASLIRFTQVFNLTSHPAATVPCGFDPAGLPIGLQVVGRAFDEATVLGIAAAYEAATGFWRRRPPA